MLNREMKKGVIDLCLLAIIARGPVNGSKLIGDLRTDSGLSSPGTVYPALSRLERLGFLAGNRQKGQDGRMRKFYRITSAGSIELKSRSRSWTEMVGLVRAILEGQDAES